MKPLIYLASFLGHFADSGSANAAHKYAKQRLFFGSVHDCDMHYFVLIVVFVTLLCNTLIGLVLGVLK